MPDCKARGLIIFWMKQPKEINTLFFGEHLNDPLGVELKALLANVGHTRALPFAQVEKF